MKPNRHSLIKCELENLFTLESLRRLKGPPETTSVIKKQVSFILYRVTPSVGSTSGSRWTSRHSKESTPTVTLRRELRVRTHGVNDHWRDMGPQRRSFSLVIWIYCCVLCLINFYVHIGLFSLWVDHNSIWFPIRHNCSPIFQFIILSFSRRRLVWFSLLLVQTFPYLIR